MISTHTAMVTHPIGGVIAGLLYVLTYFSFMNLLKYPRNWQPPSFSASAVTSLLTILMVAFVAVSPDRPGVGMNFGMLLFLSGFILLLFGIIASPAIDFNPGSRPIIEFVANHGDYAGLWMLPPAVLGGFVFPDVRLHGVLVAALSIELAWYLRHRWTNNRQLYSLGDHDTLVLNTQAEGNIKGFAKRHGIQELELSADGVQWYGCNKNTLPCPFNLYTNRLGLNTAPCCREHLKDLAYFVSSSLKEMGIVHWLEGGSLLGAVREKGNLLAWEDDVDISFLLDNAATWSSVAKGLSVRGKRDGYYVDLFESKGFIGVSYDRPLPSPLRWERNRMRGEMRLDLVAYRRAESHGQPVVERCMGKGAMPRTESGWYGVPEETILPTSTIRFLGDDIPCPNDSPSHLHSLYGDYHKIEFMYVSSAAAETRQPADKGRQVQPA